MKQQTTLTLSNIPEYVEQLAQKLKGGEIIGLVGPLGSGKTFFTKTLGKHLKIKQTITSPTFVIMNQYPAILPSTLKKIHVYHLDVYRCKDIREVMALGIEDFWGKPDSITIIEWADLIQNYLPTNSSIITFKSEPVSA